MVRVWSSLSLSLVAFTGLLGCQKDLCDKYYERTKACLPQMAEAFSSKQEYVQRCREDEDEQLSMGGYSADDQKSRSACLDIDDCDEMSACMADVTARVETRRKVKAIEIAISSESLMAIQEQCDFVDTDNDALMAACRPATELLFTDVSERATAAQASGDDISQHCRDLARYVGVLGDAWRPKAKAICGQE